MNWMRAGALTVCPHFISCHPAARVLQRIVVVNDHRAGDGRDALLQALLERNRRITAYLLRRDLIGKGILSGRTHDDFTWSKAADRRMVTVVPYMWRDEDERENQRHHHVVVEAAALIRPENVAF